MAFCQPQVDTRKLTIGLIVDSTFASKYVFDLATWGQSQGDLSISHLIVQRTPKSHGGVRRTANFLRRHGLWELVRFASFFLITRFESLVLRFSKHHADHLKDFDLSQIIGKSVDVQPVISKSGFVSRYTDQDVENIKNLKFDVLIRCGWGILRGDILSASRYGVISLHNGDNRINRGGPAGFWEIFLNQASTGFIIQQLTEELDAGNVLFRGNVRTRLFYLLNQAALYAKSNHYLKKLLKDIARLRILPATEHAQIYFNPLYRRPALRHQALYVYRIAWQALKHVSNRLLLGKHDRWDVAFSRGEWKTLVMWRANKIHSPPNHYLADPIVIREGDADYCFVEDYDYAKSKACISVYRLGSKKAERLGEVLVEPFHLSFPFLFRYANKIFMCPETSEKREIRVYECTDFPLGWKLSKVLMSGISAADTMIFEHGGMWWLFSNIDPIDQRDHSSELFIFYSDNPLTDNWTPHSQNPIFVDSTRARNAGILFDDQAIYRISQIPGFNFYGKGFAVNKILRLTTTDYLEERIFSVEPNFFSDIGGTHHLHSNGTVCVFDYFSCARMR
jgi:hypothetical protein